LIQPTAVNTPYPQHARNYMDREPKLPTPMIDPEQVAKAILEAATTPTRDRKVGNMARLNVAIGKILPKIGDKLSAKQADRQHYEEKPQNPNGALYVSSETVTVAGRVHGEGGIKHDVDLPSETQEKHE
jgi:hypothetical protein